MELGNILLFGIQAICFVIAFVVGNTTGNWGLAAPIAVGGFVGGLVIGNIVGAIEDKRFKEKMAAEEKHNEEHAPEMPKNNLLKFEHMDTKEPKPEQVVHDSNDRKRFVKVYHLTSYDNVQSIREKGVMSRSVVEEEVDYVDIAEKGALNNHRKTIICGVALDRYARCFFNPMPPMYYNRIREGYDDLCIVELHVPFGETTEHGEAFHDFEIDGAKFVKYYKQSIASYHGLLLSEIEAHNLGEIKWNSSKSAYDVDRDGTIARRGAELLVYPKIPAKYIYKVYMGKDFPTHQLEGAYRLGHPEIIGGKND